jgi:hypothetical protein
MGFAILDRSTPGVAGPLRLRSGLRPSACGKNDDGLRRGEIPPHQAKKPGSPGCPGFAPRYLLDRVDWETKSLPT